MVFYKNVISAKVGERIGFRHGLPIIKEPDVKPVLDYLRENPDRFLGTQSELETLLACGEGE